MIVRPTIVLALLFAGLASASAQAITGDWLTSTDNTVRVSSTNGRYVGTFTSGPNSGNMAMAVQGAGSGRYKGQLFGYRGAQSVTVTVRHVSSELFFDSCSDVEAGYGCLTIAIWQRQVVRPRPLQLPPAIRDDIRKPTPPPVIRRPDIRLQRIP